MLGKASNFTTSVFLKHGMRFSPPVKMLHRSLSLDFKKLDEDPLDETAASALAKSCYLRINWKISEDDTVYNAIQRMSANNIGALAVVDSGNDQVIGIISERDYLNKVGLLGRTSKDTKVSEICTSGRANLISVTLNNPIDLCMNKMINSNVRHLFVRDNESLKESGAIVGLISVKDIVKCSIAKHEAVVNKLYSHVQAATAMKYDT